MQGFLGFKDLAFFVENSCSMKNFCVVYKNGF